LWNQTLTSVYVYQRRSLSLRAAPAGRTTRLASCALQKQALSLAQERTRAAELLAEQPTILYIFLGLVLVLCSAVAGLNYGWVA